MALESERLTAYGEDLNKVRALLGMPPADLDEEISVPEEEELEHEESAVDLEDSQSEESKTS